MDCCDCGVLVVGKVGPVQNYMVFDHVWAAAGAPNGFLCVACLESRLGRPLAPTDLPINLPINWPGVQRDTPQLYDLKTAACALGLQQRNPR